jgi:hypothetical protein
MQPWHLIETVNQAKHNQVIKRSPCKEKLFRKDPEFKRSMKLSLQNISKSAVTILTMTMIPEAFEVATSTFLALN